MIFMMTVDRRHGSGIVPLCSSQLHSQAVSSSFGFNLGELYSLEKKKGNNKKRKKGRRQTS